MCCSGHNWKDLHWWTRGPDLPSSSLFRCFDRVPGLCVQALIPRGSMCLRGVMAIAMFQLGHDCSRPGAGVHTMCARATLDCAAAFLGLPAGIRRFTEKVVPRKLCARSPYTICRVRSKRSVEKQYAPIATPRFLIFCSMGAWMCFFNPPCVRGFSSTEQRHFKQFLDPHFGIPKFDR